MPIKGAKRHIQRLRKLSDPSSLKPVSKALFSAGELIQTDAQISITTGGRSGRIVHGKRRKKYQASAPGEPPTYDTEFLAGQIETNQIAPLLVEVSSNAPYARIEWDWGNVAARPYMRPARDRNKRKVAEMVQQGLNEAVRRSRPTGKD